MRKRIEIPFDSIENAQKYVRLLAETVAEARREIDHDMALAVELKSKRRVEALRIVAYNLEKLQRYLSGSGRTLNDLRSLRRLLCEERQISEDVKPRQQIVTHGPGPRASESPAG
jgi:hypothetical protein